MGIKLVIDFQLIFYEMIELSIEGKQKRHRTGQDKGNELMIDC